MIYISKTTIYCNDRSVGYGYWNNDLNSNFYYWATLRLGLNRTPNYKCGANTSGGLFESTQATTDKFSVSTSGGGNGNLTYRIVLMTREEISFAGWVNDTK